MKQRRCSATQTTVCDTAADCPGGETCVSWKYVAYVTGETELYNLTADPFELTNVTGDAGNAVVKAALGGASGGAAGGVKWGRAPATTRSPGRHGFGVPTVTSGVRQSR